MKVFMQVNNHDDCYYCYIIFYEIFYINKKFFQK